MLPQAQLVENVEEPTLIPRSVHFEVRKLFLLEAPVFGREFDSGTCTIDIPFLLGMTVKYRCESRNEFVSLWMATYLSAFREFYLKRFPEYAVRSTRISPKPPTNTIGG